MSNTVRGYFGQSAPRGNVSPINVVVNIGSDNPNRGDSRGFVGVGQTVASKTGGSYTYLTDDILAQRYPNTPPSQRLRAYFLENGYTDMYFGKENDGLGPEFLEHKVFWESRWNETISSAIGEYELVSSHITPEVLASEEKKFREHYPDLPEPIIAVNMVNIHDVENFTERLARTCENYPEATVFLTTSPRTYGENYDDVMSRLKGKLSERGLSDRIRVEGYNLNREKHKFNPYTGLLSAAKDIIVAGNSYSLVSEAVATGKQVHVSINNANSGYRKLYQEGYVKYFEDHSPDGPLVTNTKNPLNITAKIADYMIKKFREFRGDPGASSSFTLDRDQQAFDAQLKYAS